MKSNLKLFQTYPEINGEIPVDNNMRIKAAALKLDLESHSVPVVVSTRSSSPRYSIWGDSQNSSTTTSVPNPATPTA